MQKIYLVGWQVLTGTALAKMKDDGLPVVDELPVHLPSNQTALEVVRADDVTMIAFVAFSSVCILATIVGNVLVVLSIFTYRPLRGVQNYYIVSLACADLAVAIFVMPFNVADSVAGHWQFGAVFCNMWLTFDILMCTASILNLCAIAGDRFFAIHDPINYAQKRTLRRVLSVIVIVWTASAVISIPPLFGWNNSSPNSSSLYDEINRSCQLTDEPGFVLYSASGSFYIPLVIMAFLYAKIYRATRERLRKRSSASSVQLKSERRRTRNLGDSPNPEALPSPNHNGSIQLVKMCNDRAEKINGGPENVNGGAEKNVEGFGKPLEGGKGVDDKDRTAKEQTRGENRGTGTSFSDPKERLKPNGGAVTAGSIRHSASDSIYKRACDSIKSDNNIAANSSDTAHRSPEPQRGNNCGTGVGTHNTHNGNAAFGDCKGNVGDVKEAAANGNDTLEDGSNKAETQTKGETLRLSGDDALDLPVTEPQWSNGSATKKTRNKRTKNSLKISSSMPRRCSRPLVIVSIMNRPTRAQSENWTKAETHLRPTLPSRSFRFTTQSSSPDSVTGNSRLSQILENRQKISLSKERRAARTMAIVMGAFVLCWLPFFLMYVIFPFCESCRATTDRRVKNFIVWLGYINSALNPVIYTVFNIDFRRAFKSLLQGNCRIIS